MTKAQTYATGGSRPAPGTLNRMFFDACDGYDLPDAFQHKVGGEYRPISHRTVLERARRIALGMNSLSIAPGERVAILSENRLEWALVDYACLTSRVVDVPIYSTLTAEQIPYLLQDSQSVALFVSDAHQAAKISKYRADLPELRHVISFQAEPIQGVDMTLADLERMGAEQDGPDAEAAWRHDALSAQPDDLATLIYTSGTTGEPKGVMLSHDNFFSNVEAARMAVPLGVGDLALSFLPLSHVFERMGAYLFFATGVSIAYAESIDTVPQNLVEVRPTYMMAVPRLYEKMYARVLETALAGGAVKRRIFFWARSVAERWADERLAGRTPGGMLGVQYRIAQKLVFSKLQERTGGRMRYFVSGGAPLAPEINKFFFAAGLNILEGYGLTETSPVITVNTPEHFRLGTVGKPIAGVEVRIADDGEILTRGPHVMKGYFNKPEATAETIDEDGWLYTGDIGVLEDDFLRITDRKKDIIVTAGGKNIAPQPIENRVKTNKFISQAVMIGDRRRFPLMLVVPDFEALEKWASESSLRWKDRAELIALPEVRAKMESEVLGELSGLARYEVPKRVVPLEHEFSIERGELTPKLSVKRHVIDRDYKDVIDQVYREAEGERTEG